MENKITKIQNAIDNIRVLYSENPVYLDTKININFAWYDYLKIYTSKDYKNPILRETSITLNHSIDDLLIKNQADSSKDFAITPHLYDKIVLFLTLIQNEMLKEEPFEEVLKKKIESLYEQEIKKTQEIKEISEQIKSLQSFCNHEFKYTGSGHNRDFEKCIHCKMTREV